MTYNKAQYDSTTRMMLERARRHTERFGRKKYLLSRVRGRGKDRGEASQPPTRFGG
jgi:hypothetical protein